MKGDAGILKQGDGLGPFIASNLLFWIGKGDKSSFNCIMLVC